MRCKMTQLTKALGRLKRFFIYVQNDLYKSWIHGSPKKDELLEGIESVLDPFYEYCKN